MTRIPLVLLVTLSLTTATTTKPLKFLTMKSVNAFTSFLELKTTDSEEETEDLVSDMDEDELKEYIEDLKDAELNEDEMADLKSAVDEA
jgi:hypothetical protein